MPIETVALAFYEENSDQARQHETLRERTTTTIFALTGAMITVTASFFSSALKASPLFAIIGLLFVGIFIIALGSFGKALCLKHYERNRLHVNRLRKYREVLSDKFPDLIGKIDDAQIAHEKEWVSEYALEPGVITWRLHTLWERAYWFIIGLGAAITLASIILLLASL